LKHLEGCLTKDESAPAYSDIAAQLKLTEAAVKMAVRRMRARYREVLRIEIGKTVSASDDIEDEIRHLFALFEITPRYLFKHFF